MKTFIYTLGWMLVMTAICMAQGTPPPVPQASPQAQPSPSPSQGRGLTAAEVLKSIAAFRLDPEGARERGFGKQIVTFAEVSQEVKVAMGPRVTPWMEEKGSERAASLLVLAFISGNVRAQLEAHEPRNDAMAGALQVIETYQLLKKLDAKVRFASVEKWIVLKEQGKLREYLK